MAASLTTSESDYEASSIRTPDGLKKLKHLLGTYEPSSDLDKQLILGLLYRDTAVKQLKKQNPSVALVQSLNQSSTQMLFGTESSAQLEPNRGIVL